MATLSVVVPIYNVVTYLPAALDSLAQQTLRDLEVVMVDDGSTDTSVEVADRFAARDPRFRLVRQENAGLGHARNTGARFATGEFLTFVDSDDLVPHYAFRLAVRTLEATGSDFLSGNEYRLDASGAYPAPMLERNFAVTRLRTNVSQMPSLMRDLLPHNKVYRRAFWDSAGLEFPEGILFEDGPVSVRAHALAKSVDVVATPIYYWRIRDEGNRSLTQLFDDERFFVDRIRASTITADFLRSHRPELLGPFFRWDVTHKFPVMFRALPRAPAEVQAKFLAAAGPHLRRVPGDVLRRLPPQLRRSIRLTLAGDLAALRRAAPPPVPTDGPPAPGAPEGPPAPGAAGPPTRSRIRALLAGPRPLQIARAYLRTTPSRGAVESIVTSLAVREGRLLVSGYGHVAGLPADGPVTAANRMLWARHQESGKRVRIPFRSTESPAMTAATSTGGRFSLSRAGFEAALPIGRLRDRAGRWRYGTWILALGSLTPRGLVRHGLLAGEGPDRLVPGAIPLDDDTLLVPEVANRVLGFRVVRRAVTVHELREDGDRLVLRGSVTAGEVPGGAVLAIGRVEGVPELSVPVDRSDGHYFTAAVSLSDVVDLAVPVAPTPPGGHPDRFHVGLCPPGRADDWRVLTVAPGIPGILAPVQSHPVAVLSMPDGRIRLTVHQPGPVVASASWSPDGNLLLRGTEGETAGQHALGVRHTGHRELRIIPRTTSPDGSWEARVDPEEAPAPAGPAPLATGRWRLILRVATGGETDPPFHPALFGGADRLRSGDRDHQLAPAGADGLVLWIGSGHPRDRG